MFDMNRRRMWMFVENIMMILEWIMSVSCSSAGQFVSLGVTAIIVLADEFISFG